MNAVVRIMLCFSACLAISGGCSRHEASPAPSEDRATDNRPEQKPQQTANALQIEEVTCEAGPKILSENHLKIIARVRNVTARPVDLFINRWTGEKMAKHEMDSYRKHNPDFPMPYGLGIEASSESAGRWVRPITNFIWQPAEGRSSGPETIREVKIAPRESRAFTILIPEVGQRAQGAYRVFLLDPDLQRIDEEVLTVSMVPESQPET